MIHTQTPTPTSASAAADDLAGRAADKADQMLQSSRRVANQTLDRLQDGVDALQTELPGTLSRTAAKVDDLAHRGLERARDVSAQARREVTRAGDSTVAYIRDEPVKAVLIAAAAGAGLAALLGLLNQRRASRD